VETVIRKKIGDIEIVIDQAKCISASTCVVYAPKTFDLDKAGIAVIKEDNWDNLEKIVSGAKSCPTGAIGVFHRGKRVTA